MTRSVNGRKQGATSGSGGNSYCVDHAPDPGCVSTGTLPPVIAVCTGDGDCPLGQYCMHAIAPLGLCGIIPDLPGWFCLIPWP
jgi:hypothetical protein